MTRSEPPADVIEAPEFGGRLGLTARRLALYADECALALKQAGYLGKGQSLEAKAADVIESLRTSSSPGGIERGVASRLRAAPQVQDGEISPDHLETIAELGLMEIRKDAAEAALDRYRYAIAWVGADSWDHCGECRARLEWARSLDGKRLTDDEIAAIGKQYIGAEQTQAPDPSIRSHPQISESPAGALTAEKAVESDFEKWIDTAENAFNSDDASAFTEALDTIEMIGCRAIRSLQKVTGGDPRGVSALPPSSARERRMEEALQECEAELVDQIEADIEFCCPHDASGNAVIEEMDEHSRPMIEEMQALLDRVRAALSSDGRGREKGNTSNSDDGIDPSPPATNRSEL